MAPFVQRLEGCDGDGKTDCGHGCHFETPHAGCCPDYQQLDGPNRPLERSRHFVQHAAIREDPERRGRRRRKIRLRRRIPPALAGQEGNMDHPT